MKIGHVMDIRVRHHETLVEALLSGFGKCHKEIDSVISFDVLHEQLGETGGEGECRVCALVSLEEEIGIHELYACLQDNECRPAGLNEEMSYLRALRQSGVAPGMVLHLGAFILGKDFLEQRLLSMEGGVIKLVNFYPSTKLKPDYNIVVVKQQI